ncbi:hypothetical protein AYO22_05914 [Fonsecaea multimorphosa]|nr:hypothetical protein AYO22_05914 [Fonsecaea multimorphosa]
MSPSCRTKSKTGCRTCKIRKIKCDELMPECRRCTSTGRKCDGYGIWGGGGENGNKDQYQQRHHDRPRPSSAATALALAESYYCSYEYRANPPTTLSSSPRTFCVYPANALDADEKSHLEWFWCRTARKVQGAFFSDAANAVLFQASASELAVTHAVLALCSVHKRADMSVLVRQRHDDDERFALVQYNKAIKYLQPRLMATNDRTSLRLCLLSCIAFVHLEFFRCHYQMARRHLEHGLRMLDCLQALSTVSSGSGSPFVDDCIVRNLRGLYLQSTLFGQQPDRPWAVVDSLKHIRDIATFSSVHQAREYLEILLLRICRMTETHSKKVSSSSTPSSFDGACSSAQCPSQDLSYDLQAWKAVYDTTWTRFKRSMNGLEVFAYRLLGVYHNMALIMVDTACEADEAKFDRHTARFASIIAQVMALRDMASSSKVREKFFGTSEEGLSHSIADIGLMAPLFYLAVKCRVHALRCQAIGMIAELPRKEGIWDAILVAQIAAKVVAIEEAESSICSADASSDHDGLRSPEDGPYEQLFLTLPTGLDQVPVPSASRRVEAIEVLLPDGPWDPVILKCIYQDKTQWDTYLIDRRGIGT